MPKADRPLDWTGVVAVAAPGPSLRATDLAPLIGAGVPVVAVNRAHEYVPADVLYAADLDFWRHYPDARDFPGERIVACSTSYLPRRRKQIYTSAEEMGCDVVEVRDETGFCFDPPVLHSGSNSGFQAINLSLQRGARTVACFGLDFGGENIHGRHRPPLRTTSDFHYGIWRRRLAIAVEALPADRRILNCSPDSPLDVMPRARPADLL